jgi:hypothetical protein
MTGVISGGLGGKRGATIGVTGGEATAETWAAPGAVQHVSISTLVNASL